MSTEQSSNRRASYPARAIIWLVTLYRTTLSPIIGGHCRFRPTCSAYFIEAVHTRGAIVGGAMGVWRIMRCHPLSRGGYDPPR